MKKIEDKRVIMMLNGEFIYEIHKEVCSICKKDKDGKFLIISLPTYKKYVAICDSCLTKKNTGAPENYNSNIANRE
jgi:hypothetical protein